MIPVRPGSAPLSAADLDSSTNERVRFAPREVLVRFRSSADATERSEARADVGGRLTEAWDLVPGLQLLRLPEGESVSAAVGELKGNPDVLYASPNVIMELQATPNDPRFGELWGMNDIRASGAWDSGTGSRDVPVAVLDTGVQIDHPDLKDNIWRNPGETAGNGIDDDANGYIDDVNGWDFLGNDNSPGYEGEPSGAHGTHVAGTIGAVGDNGLGLAGVNWRSSIMPLTICNKGGSCYLDAAISALQYAVDEGARVSNNSYGGAGCSYTPLRDAISAAGARGHLFVAAAGNNRASNDLNPHCPASYGLPNIISVAASTSAGNLAWFSNYGDSVDLAAPGQGIVSTLPEGGFGRTGGYGSLNGTSMASPHVAGAAALLLSLNPGWTVAQLKTRLIDSTHSLNTEEGFAPRSGGLDLANAVSGTIPDPAFRVIRDGTGQGVVSSPAIGVTCGDRSGESFCSTTAARGSTVTLTATPRDGSTFTGWNGACSGNQNTCTVDVDGVTKVNATFRSPPDGDWSASAIPVFEGRNQPNPFDFATKDLSFNGASISRDGQTRARTVYEYGTNPCRGYPGGIAVDRRDGSGWRTERLIDPFEDTKFSNLDFVMCRGFGDTTTLSADGSSLLVTAQPQGSGRNLCAAFVYERGAGQWNRAAVLYPTGITEAGASSPYDCGFFGTGGSAVSADGSRIALSGSRWDPVAQKATAYFEVFDRGDSGWQRTERVELPEGPRCADWSSPMRLSISGDGNHLLFGQSECSRPNDSGGTFYWVGRVLAYDFDGSDWQLVQTIEPREDEVHGKYPQFGRYTRISEDGSTAVISSRGIRGAQYEGFGAAVVLRRDGSQWRRVARLGPPAGGNQWMKGCPAISSGGERIACASSSDGPGFTKWAGAIYVFDRGEGWGRRPERRDPKRFWAPDGKSSDFLSRTNGLQWDSISMTGNGDEILAPISPQSKLGDRYPDYRIGYQFNGPAAQVSIAAPQVGGSDNPPPQRSRTFSVSFSSPDGAEGVTGFECSANDSGWSPCSSPREFAALADGTHQLRIRAAGSGNARSAAITRTIVVDNVPPEPPTTTSKPASRTRERSPSFAFSGESNASFECRLDNDPWGSCASPKSYASLPDGDHTFQVRQADRAGNTSDTETWNWNIDATPPGAPVVDGPSGSISEDQVTFTFTGEPGGQFECRLVSNAPDSGPWTRCTSPFLASGLSHGTHHFSVRQSDDLGNTSARTARTVSFAPPASLPTMPDPAPTPGPVTAPISPPAPSTPASAPNLAPAAPAASLPVPATIAAAPDARPSARSVNVATTVNAPGPGRLVLKIRRWGSPGSEPLCLARTRVTQAGETSVSCRMGSAARETMRRRAQRVVVEVTFTPADGKPVSSRSSATLPRRR